MIRDSHPLQNLLVQTALCVAALQPVSAAAQDWDTQFNARIKWFGTASALPSRSAARQAQGIDTPALDQNLDMRLLWQGQRGPWSVIVDHTTALVQGDSLGGAGQANLNPIIDNDRARVADLTWRIDSGDRHSAWHRLDRLALQYRQGDWAVTLGRQAVSWGNGLVFQPMDLFNPFTPTAVDRDYKPGNDLLLIEKLTPSGGDLQLLIVGRRDEDEHLTGQAGSAALKWRAALGNGEFELLAGRHFADDVVGIGMRWPLGGALVRSDVVATRLREPPTATARTYVSAIVNIDYSLTLAGRTAYLFAEYYHNGFGRSGRAAPLLQTAPELQQRLQRGELFTLQKNYFAFGLSYQWHPLWTQTLTNISNLHDHSSVLATQLNYEPGDHQRLEIGVLANLGAPGDEYGGVPLVTAGDALTDQLGRPLLAGGGQQAFMRWVYYF